MLSRELSLFFELLRAGMLGQAPDAALLREQIPGADLRRLYRLALQHDVVLPVYTAITAAGEPALEPLTQALRPARAAALTKAVNQELEGNALLEAFEEAGIDCLPLKGWVLRQLYADPLIRSMADLDILFRDYRYEEIRRVMEAQGFTGDGRDSWKHDNYEKPPYLKAELHKRLTDDSGAIRAWEKGVWQRALPEEGKEHVFRMTAEDFYLFHLLHMQEDFRNGALGFRRVADTWLWLERHPEMDRPLLSDRLQELGIARFAERMERLAYACFGGGEIDEDTKLLIDYAADSAVFAGGEQYKLGRMAALGGGSLKKAKLRSLWKAVFLPNARMKAQFPVVEKWPVLLPFCWLLRIFRLLRHPAERLKKLDYRALDAAQYEQMKRVLRAGGLDIKE